MCDCRSHNGFLTAKGLEEAAQREGEWDGLTYLRSSVTLDKVGSVSGLELERDSHMCDELIDQQYRRFLNGS